MTHTTIHLATSAKSPIEIDSDGPLKVTFIEDRGLVLIHDGASRSWLFPQNFLTLIEAREVK